MPNNCSYEKLHQRIQELENEVDRYRKAEITHQRLALALKQSMNGIAMADLEGFILYVNPLISKCSYI